ncbi:hypothetical protein HMI55_006668 [Coelomomyces lativittatus]|nr:hypothetical protein HMI55_006668 [Coelomomyces lativittatus]
MSSQTYLEKWSRFDKWKKKSESTTTPTPCLPSSTLSSTFANLLPPAPAPLPPPISSSWFLGSFSSSFPFPFPFPTTTTKSSYNPNYLDNPNLKTGRHKTVISLPCLMGSIFHYTRPSDLKKEFNERFREIHPEVDGSLTLSQIRQLKLKLIDIVKLMVNTKPPPPLITHTHIHTHNQPPPSLSLSIFLTYYTFLMKLFISFSSFFFFSFFF